MDKVKKQKSQVLRDQNLIDILFWLRNEGGSGYIPGFFGGKKKLKENYILLQSKEGEIKVNIGNCIEKDSDGNFFLRK